MTLTGGVDAEQGPGLQAQAAGCSGEGCVLYRPRRLACIEIGIYVPPVLQIPPERMGRLSLCDADL